MVRDTNGYTPLLKAAALGRMEMVKALVEVCGVDPRHVDPYGVTPREKAVLYLRHDVAEYLQEMERKAAEESKPKTPDAKPVTDDASPYLKSIIKQLDATYGEKKK